MKVLIISYYYLSQDSTGSLRARAMVKYFPQNGIDVAVLTYRAQNESLSFCGNVIGVRDVTRKSVPLLLFYLVRIWQRSLRWLGIYRSLCGYWKEEVLKHSDQIIERIKPDAIVASYPSIEALEIGVALARKYGLPLISDFRDGLIFEPLDMDVTHHRAVRRYYQEIESQVVAASQLIITVSEPISSYFSKQYLHPNVMTLPNGFDTNEVDVNSDILFAPDIINIVHTGRIELSRKESSGKGKGIDALCASLFLLLHQFPKLADAINIHFVGELSRSEKNCLLPFVKLGIVKLWGHQPRARAIDFQRKANVLLLMTAPDKPSIATGKIFEYLAANKPILALTRGTAAEKIVLETGAGIVVSPDNPEAIASTLETIIRKNGEGLMKRNEELISAFSRDKQIGLLSSRLKECIREPF